MKRICTKLALACLLIIGQNVYAQSVTVSTTNPNPSPAFGTPDSVKQANGFTSTNSGTFNEFAPMQTDTIMSPQYFYNTPQTAIYFDYNISVANPGDNSTATVLIITAAGDTISAVANSQLYKSASQDYYFTFNLGTTLPANTNFKIAVIFTIPKTDKAIRTNTLTTNALLAPAGAPIPLPVNFTGFYAKKGNSNVSLTWNVAFEQNVAGYEVQRSADGSSFTKIGFVSANHAPSYNFTDSKPIAVAYYRIKSVDNDGSYKYSSIVSLKGQQSDVVLKAFPMPVQNELTIQYNAANSSSRIDILSADGRMIKTLSLVAGSQEMKVDLSTAKAGVYFARFDNGNGQTQTLKLVKQ